MAGSQNTDAARATQVDVLHFPEFVSEFRNFLRHVHPAAISELVSECRAAVSEFRELVQLQKARLTTAPMGGGGVSVSRPASREQIEAAAIVALYKFGPNLSRIARELRVNRRTLQRLPLFMAQVEAERAKAAAKKSVFRRGIVDADGSVDGVDE